MKNYYFLCGFPRSGTTLLSAIVNQDPDVTITSHSIMDTALYQIYSLRDSYVFRNFPLADNLNNMTNKLLDNFYFNFEAKHIIDRGCWGVATNLSILKDIFGDRLKVIVLRRPFLEVVASMVRMNKPHDVEGYVDWLWLEEENLVKKNWWIYDSMKKFDDISFHVIEYDDIVNNTRRVITSLYDYLGIPYYHHDLTNITQFQINNVKYDDSIWYDGAGREGVDFHTIRTDKIEKNNYCIEDVLPKSVIEKYKHIDRVGIY
jgi:sulfotransferase